MWNEIRQDEASGAQPDQRADLAAMAVPYTALMQTGPFNRFQRTLQLGDANNPRTASRALLFASVSWLPLVALAGVQGLAINDDFRKSLLLDFTVYARFLLAIPLFILGESIAYRRYMMIVNYFAQSGIIDGPERRAYDALLSDARRLRESGVAEIICLILAFAVAIISVSYHATSEPSTWLDAAGPGPLSWAGAWYTAVSLPLFQFLFLRSVWIWSIWVLFLWRLARLNLRLTPTHPDLAGGLNILGDSPYAIAVFVFAIGSVLSSALVMQVVYDNASVVSYKKVFIVFLVIAFVISFGPLLIFIRKLDRLRQRGLRDYGTLASHQTQLFEEKWIERAGVTEDIVETHLSVPDISSVSALKSSYDTVKRMKFIPFGMRALVVLVVAALIPSGPLILMEFPLKEIMKAIAGFIL
jgi:hypothetical protein